VPKEEHDYQHAREALLPDDDAKVGEQASSAWNRLPTHLRQAPLPALSGSQPHRLATTFGPAMGRSECPLAFGSLAIVHRLSAAQTRQDRWLNRASLSRVRFGLHRFARAYGGSWRGFAVQDDLASSKRVGSWTVFSFTLLESSVRRAQVWPRAAASGSSLLDLQVEAVRCNLVAQKIGKDATRGQLRRRLRVLCLGANQRRGGRLAVLSKARLHKIAPACSMSGPGGSLMQQGQLTLRGAALPLLILGCRQCLGEPLAFTLHFDRERRPCRLMAHLMFS
jgi:hypothetical protein